MTAINTYATLAEYKEFSVARGQTGFTDTGDDVVIDNLLEQASRYIDDKTARWFYPRIELRNYSLPDSRKLLLDADLLAVITFLNGEDTAITSGDYHLLPKNATPYYAIKLTDISSVTWLSDSSGSSEFVLDLTAVFGYHNQYADGWTTGSTLGEDLDTSETEWDVASETLFSAGNIIRVDNEIGIVSTTATGKINVVARGDNGSTAATHSNGATVEVWQPMEGARQAVLETAMQAYKRRFGKAEGGIATVTGAGVVLTPRDIPALTEEFIRVHRRYV